MRQIREFRSNFENISHDFPTNVAYFHFRSYDSRETFMRMWHDIRMNVA